MVRRLTTDEVTVIGSAAPGALRARLAALAALARGHAFLLTVTLANLCLTFFGIGNAYLSIGEGNTAQLGRNVLLYGYPKVWDGHYLVVPFYDSTVNSQLAWAAHPWLQYYLAAAGVALFGQTGLGARFFFALCGVLTVVAVYRLALRLSGSTRLAKLSALVLAVHPVFWLYSRQSRYYAPAMLLLVLTTLCYFRWRERPGAARLALFVVSSVLLFHTLYTAWAFLMLGLGVYYLAADRSRRTFPGFALAAALIAAFTLPWFLYAPPGFYYDQPPTYEGYWNRVAVHLWKIQVLYYPLLTLAAVWGAAALVRRVKRGRAEGGGLTLRREAWPLAAVVAYVFFVLIYPFYTTHYMLPVIPFGAVATAFLVLKIREQSRWVAAPVLALLLATNALHVLPYAAVERLGVTPAAVETVMPNPTATMTRGTPLAHYLTEQLALRSYAFDAAYFDAHERRHLLKGVVAYLKEHARPGEKIFVPWNDANAVAFYTDLDVTYRIDPTFFKNEQVRTLLAGMGRPDWIVPLSFDAPPHHYLSEEFRRDYDFIKLPYPKEYFETYPNIEFFNFRTNEQSPSWFYILKAKEVKR